MKDHRFPELRSQEELNNRPKKPIQWDIVAAWFIPSVLISAIWFWFIAWLAS